MTTPPPEDQSALAYRPAQAAEQIGVSRSRFYELVAEGKIRAKKLGHATIIERAELARYLETLPDADIGGTADRAEVVS